MKSIYITLSAILCSVLLLATPVYADGNVQTPTADQTQTQQNNTTESNTDDSDDSSGAQSYDEQGIVIGSGSAVQDILQDSRFTGAIESIGFITKFIDHWFTVIITATAFFIISAAMLKNVFAGAYCSNQKFWNKVAEAHEKADAVSIATIRGSLGNVQNVTAGGIKDGLLCLIPNIKAMTDFDDADIEPKQYFMKAIPQMLVCIIIGVFIYNGYYRDTAATVGDFGSEICSRVFGSIDAAKWVDKLTLTTGKPDNIYENDPTVQGQMQYHISSELYKTLISEFTDIETTEQKTALMRNCEKFSETMITDPGIYDVIFTEETADHEYALTGLNINLVPSTQTPTRGLMNGSMPTDSNGNLFCAYYHDMLNGDPQFQSGQLNATVNDVIYVSCSFKKTAKKNSNVLTGIQATAGANVSLGTVETDAVSISCGSNEKSIAMNDNQVQDFSDAMASAATNAGYSVPDSTAMMGKNYGGKGSKFRLDTSTAGDHYVSFTKRQVVKDGKSVQITIRVKYKVSYR